jgi:hypothetical protein
MTANEIELNDSSQSEAVAPKLHLEEQVQIESKLMLVKFRFFH